VSEDGPCASWLCMIPQVILAGLVIRSVINRPTWIRGLCFGLFYGIALLTIIVILAEADLPQFRSNKKTEATVPMEREAILLDNIHPDGLCRVLTIYSKQYFGNYKANPAANIILRQPQRPDLIDESYHDAQITCKLYGLTVKDPYNKTISGTSTQLFLFLAKAHLWLINPNSPTNVDILAEVDPAKPMPGGVLLLGQRVIQESNPEYTRVYSCFELLQHHQLATMYIPHASFGPVKAKKNIPLDKKTKVLIHTKIPTGCSEIVFTYQIARPMVSLFYINSLRINPPSTMKADVEIEL